MFPLICVLTESLKYLNTRFTPVQDLSIPTGILSWVKAFLSLVNSGNVKRYVLTCNLSLVCLL